MTYTIVIAGALFLLSPSGVNLASLFLRSHAAGGVEWRDRGPTPLQERRYTPQGMTWVDGRIVFANSWKNTRSRVYEIDPETMEVLRYFDMPEGAVHTSGLAWDGRHLWAVDYKSNKAYCLNVESSLSRGVADVVGSFDTTLRGTSACCIVTWRGRRYLAISDFMRSKETIFVRHRKAIAKGSAEGLIDFKYRNEGFSQGLEFIDGFLYEAENKAGRDIINKIDLRELEKSRRSRSATVAQYAAPNNGVEDLAWGGGYLWTSDESVFRFYQGTIRGIDE